MATIVERKTAAGESKFLVMVRLKGQPTQCATFERKTDAKRWAEETQTSIRHGRHFKEQESKKHTASELFDRYLAEGFQHKPRSKAKQKQQIEWWRKEIGALRLVDITSAVVADRKSKLLTEDITPPSLRKQVEAGKTPPKLRSGATVNRYLAVLSDCFTDAVKEYHWIDDNPVRKVKKLAEAAGRVRFLSDDERVSLVKACRESKHPTVYLTVLIALTTGARRGEILGLRWPDVDFDRGVIVLHETKNGERRAVPVAQVTLRELRELGKVRRIDTDLIFANKLGTRPIPIDHAFQQAVAQADIENFRFHDLRHTAASYLAMSGATLAEIAAVLGHKTLQMVKRYAHLSEQHTAGIVTKMTERYFGS